MPELQVGAELDRAVALALGWKWCDVPPDCNGENAGITLTPTGECPRDYAWPGIGGVSEAFFVPSFSNDPQLIEWLLKWVSLNTEPGIAKIEYLGPGDVAADAVAMKGPNITRTGETVSEALCRLVLAVSEAKEKGDG